MIMKKKNIKTIIFSGLVLLMLNSCVGLDQAPENQFTEENYWTSLSNAKGVLNTAYSQMFSASYYFSNEVLSDNVYVTRTGNEQKIQLGLADATNGRFSSEWSDCYSGIKTCHTFLDNINKVPIKTTDEQQLKERMIAEARFIRAFLFFRLTNWFGNVPFFTTDISLSESKTISPTPSADIIKWVHSELEDVATILPTNKNYAAADNGRITCGAAIAMDARVYLYDNDFANCASQCEKLINSTTYGTYSLVPVYDQIFTKAKQYNSEVILDLEFSNATGSYERSWGDIRGLLPNSATGYVNNYAPTEELVQSFRMVDGTVGKNGTYSGRDSRMDATIIRQGSLFTMPTSLGGGSHTIYIAPGSNTDDEYVNQSSNTTCTGYYCLKNYDPLCAGTSFQSDMNLILVRYADVLLMYAESMNELGKMNETIWNQTVKPLRERAGFNSDYCTYTGKNVKDAIRLERRCEFALEGLRVFDLRRWMKLDGGTSVISATLHGAPFSDGGQLITLTPAVNYKNYYFAIPQSEIDKNSNLIQNDGY